ncbi:hypothetical protein [Longimicrobium sp.]|uniref:hypothetical protein n=1 Tax=Longimicrobium sp. TaxID=2029185 RepID=UPI002B5D0D64|nr:hypothetical protein [Longimicrobium sp.]HSU12556.1 hypothetical protein [Longimicrobium sp.]
MAKRFEVEITFKQTVRYAVDAATRKAAEELALDQWKDGDEANAVGSECCDLVNVNSAEVPNEEGCARDADKAFRYLRDRELVIEMLDEDAFNPSVHDAVSAEDVAIHLGWRRKDRAPDTARAGRALDALCRSRRVVCFTRPRVRAGERGEIRLFCTPQHLEKLTGLLESELAGV